jgi:hypothetical protein
MRELKMLSLMSTLFQVPLQVVFPSKGLGVALTTIPGTAKLRWHVYLRLVLLDISSQICEIVATGIIANLVWTVLFGVSTIAR